MKIQSPMQIRAQTLKCKAAARLVLILLWTVYGRYFLPRNVILAIYRVRSWESV